MSFPTQFAISRNGARGWDSFVKYGHNGAAGTSYSPLTTHGEVQLPPPSGAQVLRAVSTSTQDAVGGAGGITVLLRGLNVLGEEIAETLTLTGTTPTAFTSTAFWRLNFVDLVTSNSYANAQQGSHVGDISIEDGTGAVWALMDSNDYPHSRWQSSWYTVPKLGEALLSSVTFTASASQSMDFKGLVRPNAHSEATPFPTMQEIFEVTGLNDSLTVNLPEPVGPFPELTDIGVLSRVSNGTGQMSIALNFLTRSRA